MTPWEKTLANFRRSKSGDEKAYWASGEMVPVSEVDPYKEYDRKTQEKYPGHFDSVKSYIMKNGIDDMGILMYNHKTGKVYSGEGNTRLAVAKELGFTHVPMRVYRMGHNNPRGRTAPHQWSREGHVPADIKPSQIGFNSMKMSESAGKDPSGRSIDLGEGWRLHKDLSYIQGEADHHYGGCPSDCHKHNKYFQHVHLISKDNDHVGTLSIYTNGDTATVGIITHGVADKYGNLDTTKTPSTMTQAGPKYDAGPHLVRKVGRVLSKMYPNVTRFGGARITGFDSGSYQSVSASRLSKDDKQLESLTYMVANGEDPVTMIKTSIARLFV